MKRTILFFPGFLGEKADYSDFLKSLRDQKGAEIQYQEYEGTPRMSLVSWAKHWVESMSDSWAEPLHAPKIFIGYSMGGRLLLHIQQLLEDRCERGTRNRSGVGSDFMFVYISVNPGISASERESRREADLLWLQRFENESWSEVWKAWNNQTVFQSSRRISKWVEKTQSPDRSMFERGLNDWSLATQEDFRRKISSWSHPMLWIAGAEDFKFKDILDGLPDSAAISKKFIPEAGHRLTSEAPEELSRIISTWIVSADDSAGYSAKK